MQEKWQSLYPLSAIPVHSLEVITINNSSLPFQEKKIICIQNIYSYTHSLRGKKQQTGSDSPWLVTGCFRLAPWAGGRCKSHTVFTHNEYSKVFPAQQLKNKQPKFTPAFWGGLWTVTSFPFYPYTPARRLGFLQSWLPPAYPHFLGLQLARVNQ